MKLHIPNNQEIKEFELEYRPITLELYYNQFSRDLISDLNACLMKYGSLTRSLALRIIWACALTKSPNFMAFIQFIDCVDYKINDFVKTWGAEFTNWFMQQISDDLGITNPYENR